MSVTHNGLYHLVSKDFANFTSKGCHPLSPESAYDCEVRLQRYFMYHLIIKHICSHVHDASECGKREKTYNFKR